MDLPVVRMIQPPGGVVDGNALGRSLREGGGESL